jgi:MATE family, multidrug efflux pump
MQLTRFKAGSIRELLSISFPLMMSSFSMLAMIFVDRLFLANFNLAAMSAAVTAGTAAWGLLGGLGVLASMAEVLVAQFQGAGRKERLGEPVWQMIWFSLASFAIFLPSAIWGGKLLFAGSPIEEFEQVYFFWLCLFGPIFVVQQALAAYFIGRGKPSIVTWLAIVGNISNVFLDWWLIFGVEGLIPPMGLKGAAIATMLGSLLQVGVLFAIFISSRHRREYGTSKWRLVFPTMRTCITIGSSLAIMVFVEIMGWTFFYQMISHVGPVQIVVASICQSIIILFMFIAEGMGRGASTIVGNFIGAGQHREAYSVFRSGMKLHLIFFLLIAILFVGFPQAITSLFMGDGAVAKALGVQAISEVEMAGIDAILQSTLQLSLFFLLFEGIRYLLSGMLTAAGDTKFILVSGVLAVLLFQLLPTYLFVYKMGGSVVVAFGVALVFNVLIAGIFAARFFKGAWQKIDLLTQTEGSLE